MNPEAVAVLIPVVIFGGFFSWLIVRTSISDAEKAKALVFLIRWLVTDGQQYGSDLQYAPLPSGAQSLALANLKQVTTGGAPILT